MQRPISHCIHIRHLNHLQQLWTPFCFFHVRNNLTQHLLLRNLLQIRKIRFRIFRQISIEDIISSVVHQFLLFLSAEEEEIFTCCNGCQLCFMSYSIVSREEFCDLKFCVRGIGLWCEEYPTTFCPWNNTNPPPQLWNIIQDFFRIKEDFPRNSRDTRFPGSERFRKELLADS